MGVTCGGAERPPSRLRCGGGSGFRFEPRWTEFDDGCSAFGAFDLVELVLDSGEDVGEAFDFAAPAALACLLDLFKQSGMGALQSGFRAGVWPGEFALLAGVFVHTAGAVGTHAIADGDLALSEVVLELVPLFSLTSRYSSAGRSRRRFSMNARWERITSSGKIAV